MIRRLLKIAGLALTAAALALCLLSLTAAGPAPAQAAHTSRGLPVPETAPIRRPLGTVDINTDDPEELTELWGVGETLSQRILDERLAHGDYHYPEDLLAVRGIGAGILERNRELLDFSWAREP